MKKSLLLLFAALATLVVGCQKEEFGGGQEQQEEQGQEQQEEQDQEQEVLKVEIDGIWYNLVPKAKQAEVTFKGDDPYQGGWYSGSITLPATVTHNGVEYSVTSIGGSAFFNCSSLTDITLPESVTSIGSGAFWACTSLTDITLPEGVTSIGSHAFYHCYSLTAINIPEGVTSIEEGAFYECSSLTAIILPEGVTSIGSSAFVGCSSLTTIVLPKSVGYIHSEAFAFCPELLDIYCHAETVPSTEANTFNGSNPEYATLHVPASALNTYKRTAPWSNIGKIVPHR